jgi:cytochrome b6-f complex iron-sulfur subunit
MSPGTIALIVVAVSVALWAAFMGNVVIRRQRREAAATAGAAREPVAESPAAEREAKVTVEAVPEKARKPLTPQELAVSRRQFLTRALNASFLGFLGFFGMSSLSFVWPTLTGGFGTEITAGNYDDIIKLVGPDGGFKPLFVAEGRFYLVYYDGTADDPVYVAVNAKETKLLALYRKCVHLGCSVPHCEKSMLFECPCHGSKYRLTGEYYGGPAPRGLDRFPVSVKGGKVVVDTGTTETGPPRGTSTWERFAEPVGPFCVPT